MIKTQTKNGCKVNFPYIFNHFKFARILGYRCSSIVCLVEEINTKEKYSAKNIPKSYV